MKEFYARVKEALKDVRRLPDPNELSTTILSLALEDREEEMRRVLEEVIEKINERKRMGELLTLEDLMEKVRLCSTIHFVSTGRMRKITCNVRKRKGEWKTLNILTVGESLEEEARLLYRLLLYLKLLEGKGKRKAVAVG